MNNLRGVLYAVVSSATFGLIPLFSIPLLQGGMSSPAILFYRFGLAAAMMGLIALATRRPLRITWPQTGTLLLLGAMYSVTALGLLRSYTYIPSSVATTINFLYPLGVAIVMTLFFREKKFRLAAGCDPHLTGGCGAAFVGRYRRSAERPCHRRRRVRGSDRADLHDLYRRCEKKAVFPGSIR